MGTAPLSGWATAAQQDASRYFEEKMAENDLLQYMNTSLACTSLVRRGGRGALGGSSSSSSDPQPTCVFPLQPDFIPNKKLPVQYDQYVYGHSSVAAYAMAQRLLQDQAATAAAGAQGGGGNYGRGGVAVAGSGSGAGAGSGPGGASGGGTGGGRRGSALAAGRSAMFGSHH
eukprot:g3158.t1